LKFRFLTLVLLAFLFGVVAIVWVNAPGLPAPLHRPVESEKTDLPSVLDSSDDLRAAKADCCGGEIGQSTRLAVAQESIVAPTNIATPASLQPLVQFQGWAERYASASVAEQARMVGEGVRLAKARGETFASLIKYDPQAAVDALLPYALRKALPPEIAQSIEHPVRGRGPLDVIGVTPAPGQSVEEPIVRTAQVKDKEYRVYTYGKRLNQITTPDTRLLGVGIELSDGKRVMALREEPFEVLEKSEAADIKEATGVTDAICPVSGERTEASGDETAVHTGEEIVWLCHGGHIQQWLQTAEGQILLAAGGSGTSPGTSPVVPPTHNQGNKKFLALRVRFSNQAANFEPASDSTMQTELQKVVNSAADWSYGKLQSTFKFSPVLTLPQSDTWYRDNGAEDKMRDDAFVVAAAYAELDGTHPYDPATFDFPAIVFSTGAFGNYCGLGTIGGNKAWIKCVGASTFLHEWGHNFGLLHANLWSPTTDSPIGPGSHVEYGSRYSPMGSGGFVSYNTVERFTLGWLANSDVAVIGAGGTYRLYNADKTTLTTGNPYALRIRQKDSRYYFVEYRPDFHEDGTHEANTDNGVLIAWTDNGSQLLDMTPLSSNGVNDASLLIGRTFSDLGQGIHITPIGKGGTSPDDWMDVVVNYEAGPSNAAPVAVLSASNLAPATSTSITLTMTASDPDGDVLAYSWEFGDGTYSTNNSAMVTKSWGTAGRYNVRCTASDRRGKEVSKSVVIRVGTPTNSTISGRVAKADGTGVADVLVQIDADHFAYTDSDGRYAVARLTTGGSYTVNAIHDGWSFSAQFTNPLTLGADIADRNFTATAAPTYGGISGEMWTGISGNLVANLTTAPAYLANTPNFRFIAPDDFETPENIADNYGQRLRGFFKAPTTGSYNFYIASDDASELYLSTSEDPASKTKIAYVSNAVGSRNYTAQANQKSAAISLTAGQRYYIEALHKEGGGGDHVSVGVDLPGGTQNRPIPASKLDPYYTAAPPTPANTVTIAASDANASEAGSDVGIITLTRTGATTAALTVYFDVIGTATYGSDYSATGLSASFAPGATTTTVTVTPVDDALSEPAETVTLILSPAPALYTLGATTSATVTIEDNEAAQVSIVASDPDASESGSDPGTLTITRTGSTTSALAVNFTVSGSAVNGTDYTAISSPVTIPAGQSSAAVTIAPIADGVLEVEETATLTVATGAGYSVGSPNAATVRIAAGVGTGGGILREWWDGIGNTNFVYSLTNLSTYPTAPTGREIVRTSFTTGEDRADGFGERWRALFTAPVTGNYFFYIASDDYSELWLSTDATPERRQKIAYVNGATSFQNWTQYASQKSAAISLTAGQRYYIEAIFKEGVGGDHMSVGVEYPNGALERPIPAHRLDPFTAATPLSAPWSSQDVGTTGSPGSSGVGSAILTAGPRNRYSFSGTANAAIADGAGIADSIGGANAVLRGAGATYSSSGSGIDLPGGSSATQAYIDLPNGVITGTYGGGTRYTSGTYEAWVTIQSTQNWSRIFDFGSNSAGEVVAPGGSFSASSSHDVMLTANEGTALDQQVARYGGSGPTQGRTRDSAGTTVLGTQVHIALVYDAGDQNWRWYRNGVLMQVLPDTEGLSTLTDVNNWLGRSNWSADSNADALYDEFRIYNYALTEAQIRGNFASGPATINTLDTGVTGPYYVAGSGVLSTSGTTDGFHFDAQSLTGDWEVRVHLMSLTDVNANAVAGIMMREGTTANARHAFIGLTPDGTGHFVRRVSAGGNAAKTDLASLAIPQWLRLVRSGNNISGFVSADNLTWTPIGGAATFTSLASTLQVGFAVASGTTANTTALAQFDNLTLTQNVPVFVWNNLTTGAALLWTQSANWQGNVAPSPATGGAIEFFTGQQLPGGAITANNDNAATFQLGELTLAGAGPVSGTTSATISGGAFNFTGSSPSLSLETTNGSGTTFSVTNPLSFGTTLNVSGAGTATFVLAGNITGAGGITKTGASALMFTGTNSYSGTTTISAGMLSIGNNTSTGTLGSGAVTNDGTLRFLRSDTSLNVTNTISGTGSLAFGLGSGGTLNAVTTLSGTNSFTGSVTINSGGARITNSNALGAGTKTVTSVNGTAGNSNLRLDGSGGAINLPVAISFSTSNGTGAVFNEAGNNSIAGNFSLASGGGDTKLVVSAGTLTLSGTFTPATTSRGLVLGGAGNGTISGTIQDGTGSNVLARLDKVDGGTWTLSGTATHTGATNINAGTLIVNGGITASSGVTIANGATLAGVGNIAVPTTVSGAHNPGDGYGTQTFSSSVNYSATGRLKWELGGDTTNTGSFDKISASGAITITSGAAVDILLNRADSTADLTNAFWSQNRSWQIVSAGSLAGTFAVGTISTDKAGHNASDYGTFSLQQNATSVVLNWTVYTPTEVWQRANFGANWTNSAIASDSADPDQDVYTNLIERALNGNPNLASPSLAQTSIIGGKLALTFVRNTANTDLTITVQGADNASGPWTDIARSTSGAAFTVLATGASATETGTGSTRNVEVRDIYLFNDPGHPLRFLRVQVVH
jgi:autotransporter-associated beta strand protein